MEIPQRSRLLPPTVRAAYGFRYGEDKGLAAQRTIDWIRRVYPSLPAQLRYVGPYQEALQRLRGRAHPGAVTRALNLLWIGKPQL